MSLEGMRIRGGIIEKANRAGTLLALHCPDDLGNRGRILAINTMPDSKYADHGFPVIGICGKRYHVVEYCRDYPELCRRFFWFTHSAYSAYREV